MRPSFVQPANSRGYSIVELIIAIGLFSIVMLLATTAYLTLIDMDRTTRARASLVNNLSFALESMSRSIRTGTNYACGTYASGSMSGALCDSGVTCFGFTDQEGREVTYMQKNDGTIGRYIASSGGNRSCSSSNAVSMTDPGIHVEELRFFPTGGFRSDGLQPSVLIVLRGYTEVKRGGRVDKIPFSLQTRATQRQFDI